jgi:hypothetical protein
VLGYVGPGAGLELKGHFVALLVVVGVAVAAVLAWPLTALLRRLRREQPETTSNPPAVDDPNPHAGGPGNA